jgi:hypothetical protein
VSALAEQADAHRTQVFSHGLFGGVGVVRVDGVRQLVVLVVGVVARPRHGNVDASALARQMQADPDYAVKVIEGREGKNRVARPCEPCLRKLILNVSVSAAGGVLALYRAGGMKLHFRVSACSNVTGNRAYQVWWAVPGHIPDIARHW